MMRPELPQQLSPPLQRPGKRLVYRLPSSTVAVQNRFDSLIVWTPDPAGAEPSAIFDLVRYIYLT